MRDMAAYSLVVRRTVIRCEALARRSVDLLLRKLLLCSPSHHHSYCELEPSKPTTAR